VPPSTALSKFDIFLFGSRLTCCCSSEKATQSRGKGTKGTTTFTYCCAQLEGAETKNAVHPDPSKRRARMKMDRFKCAGKLHITVNPNVQDAVRVQIEHRSAHQYYTDISLTDKMKAIIAEMKDSSASTVSLSTVIQGRISKYFTYRFGRVFYESFPRRRSHRTRCTFTGLQSMQTHGD
jgi:hypothetical protein